MAGRVMTIKLVELPSPAVSVEPSHSVPFSHELCVAISRPITCGLTGSFTAHQGFSLGALDWVRVQLITLVNGALCSIEKPFAGTLSCRSGQVFQFVFAVRPGPFLPFWDERSSDCGNPGLEGDDQQKDLLAGFIDGHSLSQSHNTRTGTAKRLKQDMANAKAGFLRRRELEREGERPNGQNSVQTNVDARLSDSPDYLWEGREKTGGGLDG